MEVVYNGTVLAVLKSGTIAPVPATIWEDEKTQIVAFVLDVDYSQTWIPHVSKKQRIFRLQGNTWIELVLEGKFYDWREVRDGFLLDVVGHYYLTPGICPCCGDQDEIMMAYEIKEDTYVNWDGEHYIDQGNSNESAVYVEDVLGRKKFHCNKCLSVWWDFAEIL